MKDKDDKIQHPIQKNTEDSILWAEMTKGVKPLQKPLQVNEKRENPSSKQGRKVISPQPIIEKARKKPNNTQKPELDRRTAERLRKGQMPIEARLDMHGMTREQAYTALCSFIQRLYNNGARCVLVITGKGAKGPLEPETGVLKQITPEWLSTPPLDQYVLRAQSAKAKDGGTGALYVLLKRKRSL